jgi:hypothetical protein
MQMHPKLLLALLVWLAVSGAYPTAQTTRERLLREWRRSYPCTGPTFEIRPGGGLSRDDSCVLTMLVRHRIALGEAKAIGIDRSDTASIKRASVSGFRFRDARNPKRIMSAYWSVLIIFSGKAPDIDAGIDQRTGKVAFRIAEACALPGC